MAEGADSLRKNGLAARAGLEALARTLADAPPTLVGIPEPNPSDEGRPLFNTAALLWQGRIAHRFRKALLPTYDVFDEDRYFTPGDTPLVVTIAGVEVGVDAGGAEANRGGKGGG